MDVTIIAQKPKMKPYIDQMITNIAAALCVSEGQISVKATTEEGLGFTGNLQGISAQAICSLIPVLEFADYDRAVGGGCAGCQGCKKEQE